MKSYYPVCIEHNDIMSSLNIVKENYPTALRVKKMANTRTNINDLSIYYTANTHSVYCALFRCGCITGLPVLAKSRKRFDHWGKHAIVRVWVILSVPNYIKEQQHTSLGYNSWNVIYEIRRLFRMYNWEWILSFHQWAVVCANNSSRTYNVWGAKFLCKMMSYISDIISLHKKICELWDKCTV